MKKGMTVFGISYDPIPVLRAFSRERGIEFELLSDEDSSVIRRLGLENQFVVEQQVYYGRAVDDRHQGLPHPAAFVLDTDGIVVEKHIEQTYRARPSTARLLSDSRSNPEVMAPRSARVVQPPVTLTIWSDMVGYVPEERLYVRVRLNIEEGFHVYSDPTPGPYKPLRIAVRDTEYLRTEEPLLPAGQPLSASVSAEQAWGYAEAIETVVPVTVRETRGDVTLLVSAEFQSCTTTICNPPTTATAALHLAGPN